MGLDCVNGLCAARCLIVILSVQPVEAPIDEILAQLIYMVLINWPVFPSLQRVERTPSGRFATASKCELASARADERVCQYIYLNSLLVAIPFCL